MGYPNFGKDKTIVLPIDGDDIYTIESYKSKFGIDLRDILEIKDDYICIKRGIGKILISDFYPTNSDSGIGILEYREPLVSMIMHDAGNADAETWLAIPFISGADDSLLHGYGIEFRINKNKDLSLDNLEIFEPNA